MILLSFAAIALLCNSAIAVPYGSQCSSAIPCTDANNACFQDSTCLLGVCSCASGYTRYNGKCEPEKLLGDSCTTFCTVGTCTSNTCQCPQGFVGSSDRRRCMGKALSQACTAVQDCEGSVLGGVTCNETCECITGYKPYNSNFCTWHSDGDSCTPGITQCSPVEASCTTNKCTCNTVAGIKYEWMTYTALGVTLGGCVHPDSTRNVGHGETCTVNKYDETALICADNYFCGLCPENSGTTKYECLSVNGVGQTRASYLAIVTVLLLGIKIFTA